MSLSFRELAPAVAETFDRISQLPVIKYVNETAWIFAIVETMHLLFLAILGGAVLILNLRLLGVTLTGLPARDVERATRPWLILGIGGTILTGTAMGLTTMNTLMSSTAFLVKMVALVGAILFSLAVAREARREGELVAPRGARLLALAGLAWWLASLLLFATGSGLGSGAFLVALAGFTIFAAFTRRLRRIYALGLVTILGGGFFVAERIAEARGDEPLWLVLAPLGAALGFAILIGLLERRAAGRPRIEPARLAAFASMLSWITVAAAGRWIGFT
ncbi:MAG: hypothetical protein J7500_09560 [Sphingomonas sp.]|uniref:DUF6644 family protein n=1 Tax=Sphingomonas sp. TaxID=28214 RepID=UPI001B275DDF|nr:DUF6644 family protein [Sphingomonas sp.]MBO9622945.1 hypothetical protein [Sphingomonas sp.]